MQNASLPSSQPSRLAVKPGLAIWLTLFIAFALLYGGTCQRGVSWQDSGLFQYRVRQADYAGELGIALAHPTYIALARAFSWAPGNFYWQVNVLSSMSMAVAVANLALAVFCLTGVRWAALAAGCMYGVMHISWWLATIAEVYTLSVAALTTELVLLIVLLRRPRPWMLVALVAANGFGWGVHNFALLALPVYLAVAAALLVRKRLPWGALGLALLAWLLAAGPNLALIAYETGVSGPAAAIRSALFGDFQHAVLNATAQSKHFKANMMLSALSFASFVLPLAVWGWLRWRRWLKPGLATALAALTVIHLLFFLRYPVPDQFTFFLPSATLIALAAGWGLADLASVASIRWRRLAVAAAVVSVLCPPILYGLAPWILARSGVDVQRKRELMYRDEARYWLVPWKHNESSADRYVRHAFRQVTTATANRPAEAPGPAVIVADSTTQPPFLLLRDDLGLAEVTIVKNLLEFERTVPQGTDLVDQLTDGTVFSVLSRPAGLKGDLSSEVRIDRPTGQPLYRLLPAGRGASRPASRPAEGR